MNLLKSDSQEERSRHDHVDIHGIRAAITVISGHAQLTTRRLRRHHDIDRQAMLAAMEKIECSAQRIESHLRAIEADLR